MGKKFDTRHKPAGPTRGGRFRHDHKPPPPKVVRANNKNKAVPGPASRPTTTSSHGQQQQQHQEPTIPFSAEDSILLVGEGDLSFAASIIQHHGCLRVTATVLEKNLEELKEKYPHVQESVETVLSDDGCKIVYGVDARKMGPFAKKGNKDGLMDRIIFNFPHVGGKSTDVNRQVRYNQEMLVDFFKRAVLCLAPGGTIVVTLFEGEPYTLWNIRDLARHSGLQVDRSFRFQAAAYPGYHHARTLGVVKSKKGEAGGGWKGEERPARSYVFARKDEKPKEVIRSEKKRKREDDESSSDED